MAPKTVTRTRDRALWDLARRQHGVLSRAQLLGAGLTDDAIKHRIERGKLHTIRRGVYAVGRPEVDRNARLMVAVLACGGRAAISHRSAGALLGICPPGPGIHVTVPRGSRHRGHGIVFHHRDLAPEEVSRRHNIPVTSPSLVLVDLAAGTSEPELERLIKQAVKLDLVDPTRLRTNLTDSELERWFFKIAAKLGRPLPLTQQSVNGYRVDFYWRHLNLVVETDGLKFHRTAAQQSKDARRDRAHLAAGTTPLRFTHYEVRYRPTQVEAELAATIARLAGRA